MSDGLAIEHAILLMRDAGLRELIKAAVPEVRWLPADSPQSVLEILRAHRVGFIVAHSVDADGMALSDVAAQLTLTHPPILRVVDQAISNEARERFRKMGIARVVHRDQVGKLLRSLLPYLVQSGELFTASLSNVTLSDHLQNVAQAPRTIDLMLTVACRHLRHGSALPWVDPAGSCLTDPATRSCNGWHGRVIVREGSIVFAETPIDEGMPALARLLELRSGTLRDHIVFMGPKNTNVSGSIQNALMNAAVMIDEVHRDENSQPTQLAGSIDLAPPPDTDSALVANVRETAAATSDLDVILDSAKGSSFNVESVALFGNDGRLHGFRGELDAESEGALLTMSLSEVQRIGAALGIGSPVSVRIEAGGRSLHVGQSPRGLVALETAGTRDVPEAFVDGLARRQAWPRSRGGSLLGASAALSTLKEPMRGAATFSARGEVLEQAGKVDSTVGAVLSLTREPITTLGKGLGLGKLRAMALSAAPEALFAVFEEGGQMIAYSGEAKKALASQLSSVESTSGSAP